MRIAALTMLSILLFTSAVHADMDGALVLKADGRRITGKLRWMASTKEYGISDGRVTRRISVRDVAEVLARKPASIDPAAKKVAGGNPAPAIPVLEKIMKDYDMLQWDVIAARYLADAYMQQDKASKAALICKKIVNQPLSRQLPFEFMSVYWDALLASDQFGELERALTDAIATGSREVAATAQIKRGDIQKKKGNIQDALIDGYLRTILLFENVKTVQAEALFKAADCFQEIGRHAKAEELRKRLLANYPNSPYTAKLKSDS